MIPYGKQSIDQEDIDAVISVLKSDFLTTGPIVEKFETALANYTGTTHAVAVSSGTAALHCAMYALQIGPGDEVIVPPITFASTANCVCFQGGTPVFADVEPDTLLIDPLKVEEKITKNTRAVIGVDYAGQTCDWDQLRHLADKHNLALLADSCQALGAEYKGAKTGSLADMTVFSFHPVKQITCGEGGMITTDNEKFAQRLRLFRNHGISNDFRQREQQGSWFYEMTDLGYNYRLTDIQSALGLSQMKKLPDFLNRRREIARQYDEAFSAMDSISPLHRKKDCAHAYHLYVVKINTDCVSRTSAFSELRAAGIGVNVHHIPVYLHPFYRKTFGYTPGLCPVAEQAYEKILSLPIWPGMTSSDIEKVIHEVKKVILK